MSHFGHHVFGFAGVREKVMLCNLRSWILKWLHYYWLLDIFKCGQKTNGESMTLPYPLFFTKQESMFSTLEYGLFTNDLDELPALITRKFKIGALFYEFVIFKALIEE